jgi:NADH-quinone oxidoreductase subunit J
MAQLQALIPPVMQLLFLPVAIFIAAAAVLAATTRNLFHSAMALVATLFGVAALYAFLEAEFVSVSQVLIYVGAISTLITFAVMLTRGMMFGRTAATNRQMLAAAVIVGTLLAVLLGLIFVAPWPQDARADLGSGADIIGNLGLLFVNDYFVAFELLALLLLVAVSGALLLARDRND